MQYNRLQHDMQHNHFSLQFIISSPLKMRVADINPLTPELLGILLLELCISLI
jgi:hypothetical protein